MIQARPCSQSRPTKTLSSAHGVITLHIWTRWLASHWKLCVIDWWNMPTQLLVEGSICVWYQAPTIILINFTNAESNLKSDWKALVGLNFRSYRGNHYVHNCLSIPQTALNLCPSLSHALLNEKLPPPHFIKPVLFCIVASSLKWPNGGMLGAGPTDSSVGEAVTAQGL